MPVPADYNISLKEYNKKKQQQRPGNRNWKKCSTLNNHYINNSGSPGYDQERD